MTKLRLDLHALIILWKGPSFAAGQHAHSFPSSSVDILLGGVCRNARRGNRAGEQTRALASMGSAKGNFMRQTV